MGQVGSGAELGALFAAHIQVIIERTAQALEACGFEGLLVHSGSPLMVFADDRSYPFEVNAPFKVWAPLDAPDCFVWFVPGQRPVLLLHSPTDYWYRSTAVPHDYWTGQFDIRVCSTPEQARAVLPADLGRTAGIGEDPGGFAGFGLAAVNPAPLVRRLDFPRARKSPYELACLREANRLGVRGHVAAREAFAAGASEFEIELAYLRGCAQREQELPYSPIIALNEAGSTLHYQLLERQAPRERLSMLIDAGAEFAGYASDITRTYAAGAGEFADLIARMELLQQALCAEVRPGVDWRTLHLQTHERLAKLLKDADLIVCAPEEALARNVTQVFLPHGLGHLLGLEVHDVGGFMQDPAGGEIAQPPGHPHLRLTRVLEPGFVVTMEPGLYFIDTLLEAARADGRQGAINWTRVADLKRYGGIRIEDDLAVTARGHENLTRTAFGAIQGSAAPARSAAAP
jgi:Xaa-Pro dipeptidase